jgi:hypothetical protein
MQQLADAAACVTLRQQPLNTTPPKAKLYNSLVAACHVSCKPHAHVQMPQLVYSPSGSSL